MIIHNHNYDHEFLIPETHTCTYMHIHTHAHMHIHIHIRMYIGGMYNWSKQMEYLILIRNIVWLMSHGYKYDNG